MGNLILLPAPFAVCLQEKALPAPENETVQMLYIAQHGITNISLCYRIFKNAQISSQHPYQRGSNPRSAWLGRSGPAHRRCKGFCFFFFKVSTKSRAELECLCQLQSLYPHRRSPSWGNEPFPNGPGRQDYLHTARTSRKCCLSKIPLAMPTVGQGEGGRGTQLPRAGKAVPPPAPGAR